MKIRTDGLKLISSLGGLFLKVGVFSVSLFLLAACDSIQGYPQDPENSSAVIASLSSYFDLSWDEKYDLSTDPDVRRRYRDVIVLSHMRAYDIEFDNFERGLYGQGNSLAVAGSLATITMGAVGGVAGAAVTKAALNSASAAVTGAEGAISKELYYQRTLPALISQMEADRTIAKTNILLGLKQSDSAYSLAQAYVDLESLKSAGGIPAAISNVTQTASSNAQAANENLQIVSTSSFTFSTSASRDQIRTWLYPGGAINTSRRALLLAWMGQHGINTNNTSIAAFLADKQFEPKRQLALNDRNLSIPH
jgi:hypothetical protein